MFLTASELEDLTGYKRPTAQIRWLRRHGWRHTVNGLGLPKVDVAEKNRKMVGGTRPAQEPNWGALNGETAQAR